MDSVYAKRKTDFRYSSLRVNSVLWCLPVVNVVTQTCQFVCATSRRDRLSEGVIPRLRHTFGLSPGNHQLRLQY